MKKVIKVPIAKRKLKKLGYFQDNRGWWQRWFSNEGRFHLKYVGKFVYIHIDQYITNVNHYTYHQADCIEDEVTRITRTSFI